MEFKKTDLFSMVKRDRLVVMTIVALAAIVTLISLFVAYNAYMQSKKNIYLLDRGQTFRLILEKNNIMEDRKAEAQAGIRYAMELMLTVTPDPKRIEYNISKLKFLAGDGTLLAFVNDLVAKQYYTNMVAYNRYQNTYVDQINLKDVPGGFIAEVKGRIIRVAASQTYESHYNIVCLLRQVARSENNSDGFLIEKFRLVEGGKFNKISK